MVLTKCPPKPDQPDAADRLIRVNLLNSQSVNTPDNVEFEYDGFDRRTRIIEKHGSTIIGDKQILWVDGDICEERNSNGMVTSKRYYKDGYQSVIGADSGNYYYSKDHLHSIREVTDNNSTVRARYDYDLWGRKTKMSGSIDADFGYTSFYTNKASGLDLTWFRVYSSEMGRWLSRDPLGEGPDKYLYRYVKNSPCKFIDPSGLVIGADDYVECGFLIHVGGHIILHILYEHCKPKCNANATPTPCSTTPTPTPTPNPPPTPTPTHLPYGGW